MLNLDRQNELREAYRRLRPGWRPATEVYARRVRQLVAADGRLLDLGCGRGGLVEQLEHPLPQMVGVDGDFVSLREHRLPLPRCQATGRALPFAAGSFDLIMASWVLEHLARPQEDFREIGRVLRPGGSFVFLTPNKLHPLIRLNRLVGRLDGLQTRVVTALYGRAAVDTFPAYYRANSAEALRRLAAFAGLELRALEAVPDPTYLAFNHTLFHLAHRLDRRLPESWQLHLVGVLARPACDKNGRRAAVCH
jgi:SAM-dependent methyltransferase